MIPDPIDLTATPTQNAVPTRYDAIVVGSGISGGWAAKELTQKGLRVLLLERGRSLEHVTDYNGAMSGPWEVPHHGQIPPALRARQPIQSTVYAYNEENKDF